jgi:hypothetical protein
VHFAQGRTRQDRFTFQVLGETPELPALLHKIALYDPKGETARLLDALGIQYTSVAVDADTAAYDILAIGKAALNAGGPGPNVARVRDGLKVIVFEQTSEVLEKRFGFRVAEYGLRQVHPQAYDQYFHRVPKYFSDWRGSATLVEPRLKLTANPRFFGAPTAEWCGMDVPRLWRCGCRGNVASVLIEKPARGDFLPFYDGGFSLQYSPLLEYHEGSGFVLFCQMDVTGRTEREPVADRLTRSIFAHAAEWKPEPARKAVYVGDPAGRQFLEKAGIATDVYTGGKILTDQALIAAPGSGNILAANKEAIREWIKDDGFILALGLDATEANAFMPEKVDIQKAEYISTLHNPLGAGPEGVSRADLHNRDPRELPLVTLSGTIDGDGVLATNGSGRVVFCQLMPWTYDYSKQYNLKRTFRRTAFVVSRLLGNMGVRAATPLLERFNKPVIRIKRKHAGWMVCIWMCRRKWTTPIVSSVGRHEGSR